MYSSHPLGDRQMAPLPDPISIHETIMSVQYKNRRGDTYYLLQGLTKTGKPKYYVSKKPGENTVETIPDGFEFYEHPADGIVHFRKIRPTSIQPKEREAAIRIIREITRREIFYAECEDNSLIIYWPDRDPVAVSSLMSRLFGMPINADMSLSSIAGRPVDKEVLRMLRTSPVLRFTLKNEAKRTFTASRMCYRGGDEFWLPVSKSAKLEELVRTFAPHLGQDSMFDLDRY